MQVIEKNQRKETQLRVHEESRFYFQNSQRQNQSWSLQEFQEVL